MIALLRFKPGQPIRGSDTVEAIRAPGRCVDNVMVSVIIMVLIRKGNLVQL